MLIELYGLMISVLILVLLGGTFYNVINTRYKDEQLLHKGLMEYFFYDKCSSLLKCEADKISRKGLYEIKIRKSSKPFKKKGEEVQNEVLEDLYRKLEKASKGTTNK
ncbi:MAG: hypothetical protein WCQ47_06775 [bacterium]